MLLLAPSVFHLEYLSKYGQLPYCKGRLNRFRRHQWFQDERWYDLIVILDDATSEIYYAQLVEEESTLTVMAGQKEVIESKGVFCAIHHRCPHD